MYKPQPTQQPVRIPHKPDPRRNADASHSPVEAPTPPDEVPLGSGVTPHQTRAGSSADQPKIQSSLYSRSSLDNMPNTNWASMHRGTPADAGPGSLFRYGGFRPSGLSTFKMSAERQSHAEDPAVSEDNDMCVDDVFAVTTEGDVQREEPSHEDTDGLEIHESSPSVASGSLDRDGSVPPLDSSLSTSSRMPVPVPSRPSSFNTRRSSLRSIGSPVDGVGLYVSSSSSMRRTPYNIPSRSPNGMGSLSKAYAMGMASANAGPRTTPRLPPWTAQRTIFRSPYGPSTSAPAHHSTFTLDDDETDDEIGPERDSSTEEETEFERAHPPRRFSSISRSPSPSHGYDAVYHDDDDGFIQGNRYAHGPDRRYGHRHSQPYANTESSRQNPYKQPISRSAPRSYGMPYMSSSAPRVSSGSKAGSIPKEEPSSQWSHVHMAAAALDRLSMANDQDDALHEYANPRTLDESDEVAAIRDRLGGAANCSAFISKLWHLMINPEVYGKYIRWNHAGDIVIISNDPGVAAEFASEILPKLFKHGNNASFVRQLNLYGFQRVSSSRLLDSTEQRIISSRTFEPYGSSDLFPPKNSPVAYSTAAELYGAHSSFSHPRFRRGQEQWLASMKPRSSKKPKRFSDER
ncbi:hypothetical protein MYAM1_001959 [Malassezia yamatoensis]|uniref:HSF-type DNA-binding domain-containing protein n=1 Tax=Malassezia yamatoensis TaxID=253288 RepID=A0AAJ5YTR5_9BASI|nr:hypothetical protein MYAM1_001959 [Malassezia yamatoensis]